MQIDCLHIYENDEDWVSVSALIERESLSVLVRRCFVFSLFWIVLSPESREPVFAETETSARTNRH